MYISRLLLSGCKTTETCKRSLRKVCLFIVPHHKCGMVVDRLLGGIGSYRRLNAVIDRREAEICWIADCQIAGSFALGYFVMMDAIGSFRRADSSRLDWSIASP